MKRYWNPALRREPRRGHGLAIGVAFAAACWLASTLPVEVLAQQGGSPAVGVAKAERRPLTTSFDFVGRIEAIDKVDLRAKVSGFLKERTFEEGGEVTADQLLFLIDPAQFEAAVAQRKAELAGAQAANENAKLEVARAEGLKGTPAFTQRRLDETTAREKETHAQVLAAEAALKNAEINLSYTQIRAPMAGKIGKSTFSVGALIGPEAGTLATVVSQDPMRVAFPVSVREGIVIRERLGATGNVTDLRVKINMPDGSEYPHLGKIDFIDNQVDRNMDSVLVRATLPNPAFKRGEGSSRALIDGTIVTVRLEDAQPQMVVTIPRAGLLADQQGPYVFIVDKEERAQIRRLRLGQGTADTVAIASGLEEGETVILEGLQRVRPGQPVKASAVAPLLRQDRLPK